MTANRQVHTVRVIDSSDERKTADRFLQHIEETFQKVKEEWSVDVAGFASDASGESRAARLALLAKCPWLIVLDCYGHQVNLITGDYLGSGSNLLAVSDQAEELIGWLRRRTFVLARIREIQLTNGKKAAAVLRAVQTRWTSHYHAFKRLLELQPTLGAILAEDRLRGVSTFLVGLRGATQKAKAHEMTSLMQNGTFWHALNRIKLHLEPLAIAANIAQAAHTRLDQVIIVFGFLHYRFSHLPPDIADEAASTAVLQSIEQRWAKSDQAVFIAALILNPVFKLDAFAEQPEFTEGSIKGLLKDIYTRLFREEPPPSFAGDVSHYLNRTSETYERFHANVEDRLKQVGSSTVRSGAC
ncbi:ribonuclease H-like domain-containing protein [Trametes polyzona]|nr:ribonuclease H-like domain-containing protein [Trametes polyzona]